MSMRKRTTNVVAMTFVTMAMVGVTTITTPAVTFFLDDFSGNAATDLNGQAPDVCPGGEAWVATADFKADGSMATAGAVGGSATLAFSPANGRVYTLDVSFSGISGGADWVGMGFVKGQSTLRSDNNRFVNNLTIGKAWQLVRGNLADGVAWLGTATAGTGNSASWSGLTPSANMDLRIVLDTTGGAGNWTATWYARHTADPSYTLVRAATSLLNEDITAVGFANSGFNIVNAKVESFSLSDDTAPPAVITWSDEAASDITTTSALVSATVDTNLTEAVLVWDTSDKLTGSTNDWTYRRSLGSMNAGPVSGLITNLAVDTRYTWRFYGVNASTSGWSVAATFATDLTDAQKPIFTGAVALSAIHIRLDWQDNASTEAGYVVQRSTSEGRGYATIATLAADMTSYTDSGLAASTTYYYQLAATNADNNSGTDLTLCRTSATTVAWVGGGVIEGPYTPDTNTLHLWHMDEGDPGPAFPAAGLTGSFNLAPSNGATLGVASYAGFGTAGDTSAAVNNGFAGRSIPVSDVTGADGAFTFEALVRTANATNIQQIIAMDNAGAASGRPFQFRIDADTGATPPGFATGSLRFINIAGSNGLQGIVAPMPTTGEHAFVPNEWFHVAVSYNGSEDTADNLKLYWTRMDATPPRANEILSATMTNDLAGIGTILGVGNEYRLTQDNDLKGQIDEVRISDIARAADGMVFGAAPPPGTIAWFAEATPWPDITGTSALASAVVNTNLTETVLVWDTSDQFTGGTNDWTYRQSLGPTSAGGVSAQIPNLVADTEYTWRFYGINATTGGWSDASVFITDLTDTQKPVFTGAVALSASSIRLDWQDNASHETGYVLQRSDVAAGGPYVMVARLSAETTSYTDNARLSSTTYYYRLCATNTANRSGTDFALCRTNVATDAAGLLHHWRLDGNATDSVGADHGTLNGDVGFAAGWVDGAATFDGFGAFITTGTDPLPTADYTVTAWVYADALEASMYVAGTQQSDDAGAFLRVEPTGALLAMLMPAQNTVWQAMSEPGAMPVRSWTHVAMTVSSASGLKVYIDGSEVAANAAGISQRTIDNFTIGARPDVSGSLPWHGMIDDVRIYNAALPRGEVAALASYVPSSGTLLIVR